MALPTNINDRELQKFIAGNSEGETIVRTSAQVINEQGTYSELRVGDNGGLKIDATKTAFGALTVAQNKPYMNISAVHGNPERFTEVYNSGTGSFAGYVDNNPGKEFKVSSGTSVGGYGVVRTKKVLSYRPGIGSLCRFTARFSSPVASSIQRAGLFNIGNELTFGYDGTRFGILYRTGGRPEIRKLTITQRATASQTATVKLNGVDFTAALTNSTIEQNAYEIATGATYTGWTAYNVGATVYFQASSVGAKSGTYSLTSTGNATGTFTQTAAGAAVTDTWIYQEDWNVNTLQSASDGMILNPLKGNVFKIQFQYLGYGVIRFFIENSDDGDMILVHQIKYSNTYTTPSMDFPEFKLGIIAASAGSTTNLDVFSASMAGFHENANDIPFKIHGYNASLASVGSTATNVLSLKKITVANNLLHIPDSIITSVSIGAEGTKPGLMEIWLNPTFSNPQLWAAIDEDTAVVASTSNGTISGGERVYSVAVSKSSNVTIDLKSFDLVISNDDVLCIAFKTISGSTDVSAAITWSDV